MTKHRKHSSPSSTVESSEPKKTTNLEKVAVPKLKSKKEEEQILEPNAIIRLFIFFKDAKKELTRVAWPTRKETVKSTILLVILVTISAVYLGFVDRILSLILEYIVS
jgi:preprotein translocase subunit SecE